MKWPNENPHHPYGSTSTRGEGPTDPVANRTDRSRSCYRFDITGHDQRWALFSCTNANVPRAALKNHRLTCCDSTSSCFLANAPFSLVWFSERNIMLKAIPKLAKCIIHRKASARVWLISEARVNCCEQQISWSVPSVWGVDFFIYFF